MVLTTERLVLREWGDADREPFAAMNADPEVMRHFPSTSTREQSDAVVERIRAHIAEHGFGLWALEIDGTFSGFVGLAHVGFEAHFTPAIEIGWRLARNAWGKGYATEAARRAMQHGFDDLGLARIVSMTVQANERSCRVMERIGMTRVVGGDFDHPRVPEGHPLRRHILYERRSD